MHTLPKNLPHVHQGPREKAIPYRPPAWMPQDTGGHGASLPRPPRTSSQSCFQDGTDADSVSYGSSPHALFPNKEGVPTLGPSLSARFHVVMAEHAPGATLLVDPVGKELGPCDVSKTAGTTVAEKRLCLRVKFMARSGGGGGNTQTDTGTLGKQDATEPLRRILHREDSQGLARQALGTWGPGG